MLCWLVILLNLVIGRAAMLSGAAMALTEILVETAISVCTMDTLSEYVEATPTAWLLFKPPVASFSVMASIKNAARNTRLEVEASVLDLVAVAGPNRGWSSHCRRVQVVWTGIKPRYAGLLHGRLDGPYHLSPIWDELPISPHDIKTPPTSMYRLPKLIYIFEYLDQEPAVC